jgi:dnd system-associated protein 4
MAVRRVRRPKQLESLMDRLTNPKDSGPFDTYRDLLGFAAALGFARNRSQQFEHSSEPIAWETFVNRQGNEALVNMLAAVISDDADILSPGRADDRLTTFEEYAYGGLQILQETLSRSHRPAVDVILDLIMEFESGGIRSETIELDAIAEELAL